MKTLLEMHLPRPMLDRYTFLTAQAIAKKLGKKLYRYGGRHGYQSFTKTRTGTGVGILYFIDGTVEAFRLNFEPRRSGFVMRIPKITSVDHWKKWNPDKGADRTLVVPNDLNILAIVDQVIKFLKNQAIGKLALESEEAPEGKELQEMSQFGYHRASIEDWRQKAIEMFGRTQVTQKEMQQIRDETRWVIPNVVWANEVPGIKPKRWQIPGENSVDIVRGERETSTDDESNIKSSLQAAEEVDVETLFQDLIELTRMVGDGFVKALLVTGGAGTGKTFTITNALEQDGLSEDDDWIKVAGKTSALGLYKVLFANRNGMIVFDDCDSVFATEESRNILKAVLDTNPRRVVTWNSAATVDVTKMDADSRDEFYDRIDSEIASGEEKIKFPNKFEFTGRVIFISNLNANQIEEAIRSRSAWIDVTLTSAQIFDRIAVIMDKINVEDVTVSMTQKGELLEYLRDYAGKNPSKYVSMRNFIKGLNIIASGNPRWRDLLKYV